LIHKL